MSVIADRMAGQIEGEFVVFLIGMRFNRLWKPWKWIPVILAMPKMLRELAQHPELGYLGGESWFGRTTIMVQYWRSMDQLMTYAKNRDAAHLPAWSRYNKAIGTSGDVGVWHETYRVRPGDAEAIYANMPPMGLGKVGSLVPARGQRVGARERLAAAVPASP